MGIQVRSEDSGMNNNYKIFLMFDFYFVSMLQNVHFN